MITQDELVELVRQHDDPFVTANDIADSVGMARQTAHKHLQRAHENGEVEKKKIGSSAVIWWIDGCCH